MASNWAIWLTWLVFLLGSVKARQDYSDYDQFQEFAAAREGERGLFPNIFNLATHADIRATATCGTQGPEYYCKLVEHVFMRQPQCDICDANNHYKNHPIDYAIDGTRKWWQSPSLANGLSYEKVNITLDLRQEYQVAYVIVKAGNSPRPGTWLLEKSLDGVNYSPWQYFAINDHDCMRSFGVPASTGVPKFAKDDEVICTSFYSRLDPLENGEIHISLVNGRPGADHPTEELQNFTRTRFVRLRLLSLRTLNADIMVINRRDGKLDHSVTRRYFYSISDISIGGQCICYGHAERCPPEQFRCECRHNTCGESCNECCPLFNQLPWKMGTHAEPNICQPCQCFNHADRCEYDAEIEEKRLSMTPDGIYEGGGRCIDCRDNTEGINCEKCKYGFYRPSNVSHYLSNACRPCDCDPIGSEHMECVRDETSAFNGLRPGDCICKPGFGGRRCDRCAPGFRNHPVCERCPCNQAGSVNFDTCEEDECICKPNVEGKFCDKCKPGTIFLNPKNPLGCQQCFCFGKTGECVEGNWDTGHLVAHTGWNLTDLQGQVDVPPELDNTELLIFTTNDYGREHSLYYWKAPVPFHGNLLNSYGGDLHYYVYFVPAHDNGYPTPIADLVIEGNGIKVEYYSRLNFFARENMSVTIPLREGGGWYNSLTRLPIEKADLMRVLSDTKKFLVRARYNQEQVQASIYGLTLETAVPAKTPSGAESDDTTTAETTTRFPLKFRDHKMNSVEVCSCPEHFTGHSCERCEPGYRRVNEQLYDGRCEKCNCEGHSEECDPYTGFCLNCRHNTTGGRCEQCLPGYYGNPSLGGELGACKPCACPTLENNHSPQCTLSQLVYEGAAATDQDEYVCTACDEGYDGPKCDICADGYFGDPLAENGTCQPCSCNGNIDAMAIGNCDRKTGKCLKCIGHTTGDACERCEDNHYGSALDHTCKPCSCHHVGSTSLQCSNETGTCECKENYVGPKCDRCKPGHGDVENNCPACNCNATGAIGIGCDEVSGQCSCKKGVYGKQCDMCVPSYFNFTEVGCQFCHCDEYGAVDDGKKCDNVTGKCECRPNVDGTRCEQCLPGFFNITSGEGCQSCGCNEVGSTGTECNIVTGQCVCKSGVTGLKCDKCAPNHYGLNEEGCKQCQVCPAPGQVCDPITGDCVCPPNTVGEMCEKCTKNAWNYHPLIGCELCDCSGIGADSSECNPLNGQCKCKAGYVGHKCDHCEAGYFNFPDCEPCNCDPSGTDPLECRDNLCLCSNEGQCKCKKHVTGLKCDQCDANSFSLEKTNPTGCTECFCFNRTNFCVQSSLVWQQMYTPDRRVMFEDPFIYFDRKENLHILKEYPLDYNSYPTNHTPLYWPLPRSFLGDRTGSYNGFLRFRIWNDDNYRNIHPLRPEPSSFRLFPQVLLIGNDRIKLEHVPNEISDDGKYKIRLHESQWRNRISPQVPVTRKQLMVALQKVQAIYVRGTYNDMYRGDSISLRDVSLDISVSNVTDTEVSTAIGVERCADCPEGYAGDSCQNPAEGYCRKRHPDYLNNPDDIALIGFSSLCACHGHSATCDPETCRCTDCQHNTEGDFCDRCTKGYYGDAKEGRPDSCMKCACPLATNSFSDTCITTPSGRGYVCDACRYGYKGSYCEICEVGFYGNPNVDGGHCQPCNCHVYGSLSPYCHNVTGQCECRDGVEGRDCSQCRPRHAFINQICTSCDQGCYKDLMIIEDELEEKLQSVHNFTDIKPIPYKRLGRIHNETESFNSILDSIFSNELDAKGLLGELGAENRYVKQANIVVQEANILEERNNGSSKLLAELQKKIEEIQAGIHEQNFRVVKIGNELSNFTYGLHRNYPAAQVDEFVTTATERLQHVRDRDVDIEKRFNYAKKNFEDAEKLLKEILSKKLNDTSYDMLFETHAERRKLIKDFRDEIWDNARSNATLAKEITDRVNNHLKVLQDTIDEINKNFQNSKDELGHAEAVVEKIKSELLNIHDHYQEIDKTLLDQTKEATDKAREMTNIYQEFLPDYHVSHVRKAEQHAKDLEHKARKLKNAFYDTEVFSKNALTASKAYSEIADALKNASKAAVKARADAEDAFGYADPVSDKSLVNMATNSVEKSRDLEEEAKKASNKDNVDSLKRIEKLIDNIELIEANVEKNISWIKDVHKLLEDHNDRIDTVHATVDEAANTVADIQKRVDDFSENVKGLKSRTDAVGNFNPATIQDEIKNVSDSAAQIEDSLNQLEDVRSRAQQHDEEMAEIKKDISVLKEKIKEAREKAAKVKIAVKSEVRDNCVREYISPAHPSPTNTISLKYRPALDVPDSLLFLTYIEKTRGTQAREYIAIELKERRIIVHWNIGSGNRKATNSHNIGHIAASDRYTWYHIDVKRNGNSMKISVAQKQTLSGETSKNIDKPTEIMVGEPDATNDVILNTEPGKTRIYVGHSSPTFASELGLATNKFNGVLNELSVDGQVVPLWVFASQSGTCDGSAGGPKPIARGHMFRDGFAQIHMQMTERPNTLISIEFSAYSPNGLLYFRGNQETHEYVAIQLHKGGVEVRADFGDESKVVASSIRTNYADGRVHKIKTVRNNNTVLLQIDSEDDRVSVAVPNDNTILDIKDNDAHFVGGVPPDFDKTAFPDADIQWSGFFGCIQSVKPNQVRELDLDNPVRSQRKEPGCEFKNERLMPTDRVIGFPKAGYLISSGIELTPDSSVAFNFKTKNSNAVLMYQSGRFKRKDRKRRQEEENDETFFAFYLFNGRLIVHLGTDSQSRTKRTSLSSTNSYNDGRLHSVFIARVGPKIEVRVDDREVLRTEFTDLTTIGSSNAQLFLGGFPEKSRPKNQNQDMGTSEPLIGCLSDFYYNYEKMPVIPETHQATLGYCAYDDEIAPESDETPVSEEQKASERKNSKLSLQLAAPTLSGPDSYHESFAVGNLLAMTQETCPSSGITESPSISGVRYGASSSSHSRINFPKPYPEPENLKLTFSFRTPKKEGIIWVWANYQNYTRYFFLSLERGFLKIEVQGHKGKKSMRYNAKRLNDDEWHRVHLMKQSRELRLQVDDLPPQLLKDVPNPKVMKKRMYVGGVISRHKKNFTLPFEGFEGCIKNFEVNGEVQDLVQTSRDVVPCAHTKGVAYIHSGGFATFGSLREYGPETSTADFTIRFRSSGADGLVISLLSNANHMKARVTAHIESHQLVFNIVLSDYEVKINQQIETTICDNQWHELAVLIGVKHTVLRLDDIRREIAVGIDKEAIDVIRSLPVHVGGLTANVAVTHNLNSTVGCFKDLHLSGTFVPFKEAKRTNKVIPDGCPYA